MRPGTRMRWSGMESRLGSELEKRLLVVTAGLWIPWAEETLMILATEALGRTAQRWRVKSV